MKVKDKIKVTGRGCVIILEPDCDITMSDKVICGEHEFTIAGIERLSFVKTVGLILRPNDIVHETINVGDNVIISKQ